MATGQTVIDQIRDELQDTDDVSFSDAELLRYINRGAKEFCTTTGCLDAMSNVDTDGSSYNFKLASSLTNPVGVLAVTFAGTPLDKTYLHEISYQFGGDSGTPTAYLIIRNEQGDLYLRLDYVPISASGGDDALRIWYLRTPTKMTAVGSTFDFPDEWESAIVAYALARCYNAQRDSVLEAKQMVKYETLRQSALAINKWRIMGDAS